MDGVPLRESLNYAFRRMATRLGPSQLCMTTNPRAHAVGSVLTPAAAVLEFQELMIRDARVRYTEPDSLVVFLYVH